MATKERKAIFGLGDTVKLASGGPEMTVNQVESSMRDGTFNGKYRAQWFAGKKLESGSFPEESLELVKKKG